MGNKNGCFWKEVFDKKGNFLGYTEMVKYREYNHYDQDGNYLGSTEDGKFDFCKNYLEEEDKEEGS